MSASGINFAGLGTGIDTESIIQKLIEIERRPARIMDAQRQRLQQRQTALNTISAQLLGLQTTVASLNRLRAFDIVQATSSNTEAVTVSAQAGAQTGQYHITVNHLAQAQVLASTSQSSQTAPLGFSGQIVLNGKAITVRSEDSLQTLAGNINAARAGVTASILSPNPGEFYLTLGSNHTGVQGRISLSDTAGGTFLANTLGIFSTDETTTLRNPIGTTGAGSALFSDSGTSVGTLLGLTNPVSGTVQIGSGSIEINLGQDSLSAIAAKINTAGISGVSAFVAQVNDPLTNTSRQQLQINGTQSFTDSNNVLANLGVVQRNVASGRELTAARDASFTLNGLTASRPTNSFSDAISGVTLTLNRESASSSVNVSADIATIKTNINAFVKNYNDALDAIASLSQFDPDSGRSGPLFGDAIAQGVVDRLFEIVTTAVSGLPNNMSVLPQIGVTLDTRGRLVVNDAELTRALSGDLTQIARLFRADGVASDAAVQFVSSSDKTRPSGSEGYKIVVTQAAEQAVFTATTAQTGVLAQDEVLTFGGALFGASSTDTLSGGRSLTLRAGSTLADVVATINADSTISALISASISPDGRLQLTSKSYGSAVEFAVRSGVADSGDGLSLGIGTTAVSVRGKDVQGTINGEEARGNGQFLTGSREATATQSAGSALGLQVRVTATAPGNFGTVVFTSGIADQIRNLVTAQTDAFSGALTTASNTVQREIDDLQSTLQDLEERLKNSAQNMRLRFTAMESAVIRIRSANAGLAQLAALQTQR
jgi:flagellar hook-associated protein 2